MQLQSPHASRRRCGASEQGDAEWPLPDARRQGAGRDRVAVVQGRAALQVPARWLDGPLRGVLNRRDFPGMAEYGAWNDVYRVFETRRKLVQAEQKRRVDMQQMITTEQAMVFMTAVVDVVQRNVHDPDTLAAISRELANLAILGGSGTTQPKPDDGSPPV